MSRKVTRECDCKGCGKKATWTKFCRVGDVPDPSGHGYLPNGKEVDLCPECLGEALSALLDESRPIAKFLLVWINGTKVSKEGEPT